MKGGWFEGPKIKRDTLRGTWDWFVIRPGGVAEGYARDTYRTRDGCIIHVGYRGIRNTNAAVWEQLGRGEEVDPSSYYLRGQPMFETAVRDNPYSWLNTIIAVSVGKQEKLGVTYDVYQIH